MPGNVALGAVPGVDRNSANDLDGTLTLIPGRNRRMAASQARQCRPARNFRLERHKHIEFCIPADQF